MPQYRAKQPGFINGCMYGPNERSGRQVVTTEKPLNPVPSWLELVTEAQATGKKGGSKKPKDADAPAADAPAADAPAADAVSFIDPSDTSTDTPETL